MARKEFFQQTTATEALIKPNEPVFTTTYKRFYV
jgi:hypothetical protein